VSSEIDCAWYLIVERMTKLGQLDKLGTVLPPRNWATSRDGGPRRISLEHIRSSRKKKKPKANKVKLFTAEDAEKSHSKTDNHKGNQKESSNSSCSCWFSSASSAVRNIWRS